jgi:hypothetical protein
MSFFTMPEYERWKEAVIDAKSWKIKYYKVFILIEIFTKTTVYTDIVVFPVFILLGTWYF